MGLRSLLNVLFILLGINAGSLYHDAMLACFFVVYMRAIVFLLGVSALFFLSISIQHVIQIAYSFVNQINVSLAIFYRTNLVSKFIFYTQIRYRNITLN